MKRQRSVFGVRVVMQYSKNGLRRRGLAAPRCRLKGDADSHVCLRGIEELVKLFRRWIREPA